MVTASVSVRFTASLPIVFKEDDSGLAIKLVLERFRFEILSGPQPVDTFCGKPLRQVLCEQDMLGTQDASEEPISSSTLTFSSNLSYLGRLRSYCAAELIIR